VGNRTFELRVFACELLSKVLLMKNYLHVWQLHVLNTFLILLMFGNKLKSTFNCKK
jgi:hypothetical protein